MIDPALDISEYESFFDYLKTIRTPSRPYSKFVSMVINLPRDVALAHLTRATNDSDNEVICEALDLLAKLYPEASHSRCLAFISHDDSDVRRLSVELLRRTCANCEDDILQLLSVEKNDYVRYACVQLLADIGTSKSTLVLQDVIARDKSVNYEGRPIRSLAEEAINRIALSRGPHKAE